MPGHALPRHPARPGGWGAFPGRAPESHLAERRVWRPAVVLGVIFAAPRKNPGWRANWLMRAVHDTHHACPPHRLRPDVVQRLHLLRAYGVSSHCQVPAEAGVLWGQAVPRFGQKPRRAGLGRRLRRFLVPGVSCGGGGSGAACGRPSAARIADQDVPAPFTSRSAASTRLAGLRGRACTQREQRQQPVGGGVGEHRPVTRRLERSPTGWRSALSSCSKCA